MNASIVARRLELTDAMREYVAKAVEQLEKYNLDIIAVKTIVEDEGKRGKTAALVEFTIQLAHRDTIVIKQTDKDFYAAVDFAIERAKKALRRYKDRVSDKIGKEVPHKYEADIPALYSDIDDEEVIEAAPEFSFSRDEALTYLKETGLSFVAFGDKESGKLRILYRRKDGRFGLY
ncbi:MAG: ribosome-associated translation inhibitor RaiA [Helicobacteraceae bacterium]|jgi:putative sigma-54 modulation protein|nr:ribosome-associated translation inhibitor RaiA [Helicobacteraceae bacterium]